jgi:hypothetical protein
MSATDPNAQALRLRAQAAQARRLAWLAPEQARDTLLKYAAELEQQADKLKPGDDPDGTSIP